MSGVRVQLFPTALGWTATVGGDGQLHGVVFGYRTRDEARKGAERRLGGDLTVGDWNDDLACRLMAFAGGERTDLSDLLLADGDLSPFQRDVLARCRQIRWGTTWTYGELAERAGHPGAARAVGTVMARNRWPLVVPCHRVIAAHGRLGGYSARQGVAMKWRLLCIERAAITARGPRPRRSAGAVRSR